MHYMWGAACGQVAHILCGAEISCNAGMGAMQIPNLAGAQASNRVPSQGVMGFVHLEFAYLRVTRPLCQNIFKRNDCLLGLIHLTIQQSSVILCIPILPVSSYDLGIIQRAA